MASRRFLFAIFVLASLGCAPVGGMPGTPTETHVYRVAPPDILHISVRPTPEITREVLVRPDGRISFDLIGEVDVEGKTIAEIQREITSRIEQFIVHPDVTVLLQVSASREYYIFGEIRRPGAYPLIGHVTALEALGTSLGPTRHASLDKGVLIRPTEGGELRYTVKFKTISQRGDSTTNYELQPGDVVYVPPNLSARIGYALGVIFFPLQQIIGLGSQVVYPH